MSQTTTSLTLCELADATETFGVESLSPFCLKAHRALRVAGLSYARRHGTQPASFRALNPAGQVPVLLVGETPVPDTTRILARIAELVPGSIARDPEALLWEELADTSLNAFLVASRWADDRNWPAVRDAYFGDMPALLRPLITPRLRARVVATLRAREVWRTGADACWARFEETLDLLDARAPRQGFWVGDRVSAADLGIFAQLRSLQTDLTPWQRDRLAARPRLHAYVARIDALTRAGAAALPVAA